MNLETVDLQLDNSVTRRQVVKTGVKLAYAAPLVAATFKLSAKDSSAAVSAACVAGTCSSPIRCGFRCRCRISDGVSQCLQNIGCLAANLCTATADCIPGYTCLQDSCCGYPVCVPTCGTVAVVKVYDVASLATDSTGASDGASHEDSDSTWALGPLMDGE